MSLGACPIKIYRTNKETDHAYKGTKEYHDSWHELYSWLEEAEKGIVNIELYPPYLN
jgi:hypothetical protein